MSNDTITLDPIAPGTFDVHNWRPVPQSEACQILARIAMTRNEPFLLGDRVDTLPDGRTRVAYYAYIKPYPRDGEAFLGPYLMLIHTEETRKQVWLERQDVELALG